MNIINKYLNSGQYNKNRTTLIRQIVLHHTQGSTADGAIEWWNTTTDVVGTNYIIDKDGSIYCTIPETCWAYTLGVTAKSNDVHRVFKTRDYAKNLEMMGISIELVSLGELILKDDNYFFESGNRIVANEDVIKLDKPHRGYTYYDKYTQPQIDSLKDLILYLTKKYYIPIEKNYSDIFDVNTKALRGFKGIYSHVCYRSNDKTDLCPQPNLITMLNSLYEISI